MIYVLFNGNEVVGVTSKRPFTPVEGIVFNHVETSDDWTSFDQVTKIAEKLTTLTGKTSSRWLNHGWSLVKGHRSDLNPSF